MLLIIIKLLILCLLQYNVKPQLEPHPKCLETDNSKLILESKSGKIKGTCSYVTSNDLSETKNDLIYSWLSVPYAEPPINENRFKTPKPVKPWSGILDGTKIPNSCMQYINPNVTEKTEFLNMWSLSKNSTSKLSEDCLYLNIHASKKTLENKNSPILFFIHGGHGSVGSGSLDIYNPSVFVLLTDIIVITINYRLDVFGFLYLKENDQSIEGNQGILDQHLALKWVYENADKFGGDRNKITLMGSDDGAKFVGYHLLFKQSWPYFRNVILQSGSPVNLAKNSLTPQLANSRAEMFFKEILGCKQNRFISCAKNIDSHNLTLASRYFLRKKMSSGNYLTALNLQSAFAPVVDGKWFSESPIRGFRTGNYKKCNIIIGFNTNEGSYSIPFGLGYLKENVLSKTNQSGNQVVNFTLLVDYLRSYYSFYPNWPFNSSDIIINSILHEYTKLTNKNYENSFMLKSNYFYTLSKILSDESFICPAFKLIDLIAKKSKVYLYAFNYRISNSKWPKWYGVSHGDELSIIFGHFLNDFNNRKFSTSYNPWEPSSTNSFNEKDKQISKELIKKWANFIRNDVPNDQENSIWPTYNLPVNEADLENLDNKTNKNLIYLSIRNDGIQANKNANLDKCHFWNGLLPAHLDELGIN